MLARALITRILFLGIAAVSFLPFPLKSAEKVTLRLRWDHQFQFAGYYAAKWQGFYQRAGLDVTILSAFEPNGKFHSVTREVSKQRAHFGTGSVDILKARDQGAPLVVLASIFQLSPVAFYALKGTRLENPADLVGLRVATVQSGSSARVELRAMLRAENIPHTKILEQPIREKLGLYDLAKGHADVVSGFTISAGWVAKELDLNLIKLRPSSYGVNFYGSALFTHQRWVRENPKMVQRFVAASIRGWEYALTHSEEIADRISTKFSRTIPIRDVKGFNRFQIEPVRNMTQFPVIPIGNINPFRWQLMHDSLKDAGEVSGALDLQNFIYDPNKNSRIWESSILKYLISVVGILLAISLVVFAWNWTLRRTVATRSRDLVESEKRYRSLVERSPFAILVHDFEKVVFVNASALRLFQVKSLESFLGHSILEFVLPKYKNQISRVIDVDQPEEDGPPPLEVEISLPDGSQRTVELVGSRLTFNGRRARQVVIHDLTERKAAEEKLRASEGKYRDLIEGSIQGIAIIQNLKLMFSNKALAEIYGYQSPEELIGRDTLQMIIAPCERERIKALHFARMRGEEVPDRYEFQGVRKDGSLIWLEGLAKMVEWNGKPAAQVTYIDITERKKAEQDLIANQNLIQTVFDTIPHNLFVKDANLQYLMVNRSFAENFAETPASVLDKRYEDLNSINEEDARKITGIDQQIIKSGKPLLNLEIKISRKDGKERYIRSNRFPLLDSAGKVVGIVGLTEDISERKKAEEALRNSERIMKKAEQIAHIGSLEWDIVSKSQYWSDEIWRIIGREPQSFEPTEKAFADLLDPDDKKRVLVAMKDAVWSDKPFDIECRVVRPDGTKRVLRALGEVIRDESGRPLRMTGTIQDLTEWKKAEQDLRENQRLLQTVFDTIPHTLIVKDKKSRYVKVNKSWCDFYGLSPEDVLGRTALEIPGKPEEEKVKVFDEDQKALEGEDVNLMFEHTRIDKNGSRRHMENIRSQILDDNGNVVGLVGIALDITQRKKTEEDLISKQNLIQAVFDAIPFSIFVKDLDHQYLLGNKTWLKRRGIEPDEVRGLSTWDLPLLTEKQKSELIEIDKQVFKTGKRVDSHEFAVKNANGELRIYNQNKVPLPDHEGNIIGLVAVSMDVTEITEARNELQANKNLLQTIFDNIPIGIQVRNRANEKLFVNKVRAERVGMTPDEFLNSPEPHPKYWEEEAIEEIERINREVLDKGIKWEMTRLRKFKEFPARWIKSIRVPLRDRQGIITGLIDVSEDITDLKLAEEKQRQTEELMQTVVKNAPIILWSLDRSGVMTLSEGKGLDRQGFKPKEMVGQSIFDIYKDHPDFLSNVRRAFAGESFTAINETRGSVFERWFEPIKDEEGEVTGLIGVSIDITERTSLENQLRQAQKMEAVGHLAGGVAHDFNNLLHIIQGYANRAVKKIHAHKNGGISRDLEKVIHASQSAADLTGQLLAFSRQQVLKLSHLDVGEVVENLMKMLQRLIGEDVELCVVSCERGGKIEADRSMIEQVLMNLCVNARDAMPDGGRMTIETSAFLADETFCAAQNWAHPGRYMVITVSDTGVGISAEHVQHIFEPFFTTKKVGEGTGLGLSVVYGIVEQHHGQIMVSSEEGVGTTFKVFLPASDGQNESPESEEIEILAGGKETILVAEDEPGVLELIVSMLEEMGYTVVTARDGVEACAVFDDNAQSIDLALLDVIMPKMLGKAVYDHIRKTDGSLPVVFSTGYTAREIDSKFLAENDLALLQKPYSPQALFRTIKEALANRTV